MGIAMRHVVYTGPHKSLVGKMALARPDESSFSYILVQFDRISTGLGFGWRALPAHHFKDVRYKGALRLDRP